MFNGIVKILKARNTSFKGTSGDMVQMYYFNVLTSTGDVVEVTGTKEAFEASTEFDQNADVAIEFALYESNNAGKKSLKAKVHSMKAA